MPTVREHVQGEAPAGLGSAAERGARAPIRSTNEKFKALGEDEET